MNLSEVPGHKIVEDKIREINDKIVIEQEVPYDFDRMLYKFKLLNNDRKCSVILNDAFLDDLNDYTGSKTSEYWKNMESTLVSTLLTPIEKHGLIPFTKEKLKELIFEHIKKELQHTDHINKFNLLGRPYQEGSLERFLGVKFDGDERANAGMAFEELKKQGILIPTYKDLVSPEDWVKISKEGEKSKLAKKEVVELKKEDAVKVGDLKKITKIPIKAVFLSSTIENLQDCRAEVINELESRDIKVIYSESPDFAGIPRNNVYDICLQNVLTSPLFIIILDRKYGDLYQGAKYNKFKDISITHAEFKVVLEDKEKSIFFYVRDYVWHDYKTWKNNQKLKCETDHRVFNIIKEFEDTREWIDSFKTSVELKSMILRRLGIS